MSQFELHVAVTLSFIKGWRRHTPCFDEFNMTACAQTETLTQGQSTILFTIIVKKLILSTKIFERKIKSGCVQSKRSCGIVGNKMVMMIAIIMEHLHHPLILKIGKQVKRVNQFIPLFHFRHHF